MAAEEKNDLQQNNIALQTNLDLTVSSLRQAQERNGEFLVKQAEMTTAHDRLKKLLTDQESQSKTLESQLPDELRKLQKEITDPQSAKHGHRADTVILAKLDQYKIAFNGLEAGLFKDIRSLRDRGRSLQINGLLQHLIRCIQERVNSAISGQYDWNATHTLQETINAAVEIVPRKPRYTPVYIKAADEDATLGVIVTRPGPATWITPFNEPHHKRQRINSNTSY